MSPTRRIILNFLATYGRSLFALACGLFTSRWVLMSLGDVDFGLFGLVGGLTAFVTFFNDLLSTSVSRYYGFSVGAAAKGGKNELRTCQEWFNVALFIHTIVPVLLLIIGYPIVEYIVRHYLTIPPERLEACVWVSRFSCLACFVGMISVPFNAMYIAKQYIAELTIYSVVTTALRVVILYYMVTHPRDYLTIYAAITALLAAVPQIIITWRALKVFPECRFVSAYLWQPVKMKALFVFAGYRFTSALSIMAQSQGMALIVNKMMGASRNAAMALGNTLASQGDTLSNALFGALSPAITNAAGVGDMKLMRSLSYRACKFGTILILIFAIPMSLEMTKLFELWLKTPTPPVMADKLCLCCLWVLVLEKISAGHYMVIFAVGQIAGYQLSVGICGLLGLPIAIVFAYFGFDLLAIGYAMIITKVFAILIRLYYARKWAQLSVWYWLTRIFTPLTLVTIVALGAGWGVTSLFASTLSRIAFTILATEFVFLPLVWFFVIDAAEHKFCFEKIRGIFS